MPDGVIKWVDPTRGDAEIVRGGHSFPAHQQDIEPVARRTGARVHFDVQRVDGVPRAVDVRLRAGTRVSHRQHRFGTLVGARASEGKGPAIYAHVHPELRNAQLHPLQLVRVWADAVANGDVTSASSLYAPDALVHVGQHVLTGVATIERWLEGVPSFGSGRHASVHGTADGMAVAWWPRQGGSAGLEVRSRIAHGEIVEQWQSETHEAEAVLPASGTVLEPELVADDGVPEDAKVQATTAVVHLVERLREPVLFARVKLSWEPDPARSRPAVIQVALDVDGDLVRAQAAAPTMPEALDRLVHRLHDRLEHRARHREYLHRSSGTPSIGEWHHGDLRTLRPPYFDRPEGERDLVRHKAFALGELTPDEAVFDMEQLDYDFYLFSDLATGSDAIVERVGDGSYRLTRLGGPLLDLGPTAVELKVNVTEVPTLSLDEAIERLNVAREPHVFFADALTGRGTVLYRLYDGHYGLITPG